MITIKQLEMNYQKVKALGGRDDVVVVPRGVYKRNKKQINNYLEELEKEVK